MHTHMHMHVVGEVAGPCMCAHPPWQVMLLVNASRMIERRLNKIARLHARRHAQRLGLLAAAELATYGSRHPRSCARWPSALQAECGLLGLGSAALEPL